MNNVIAHSLFTDFDVSLFKNGTHYNLFDRIWEGFIPNLDHETRYKYKITSTHDNIITEKADPYGISCEVPPRTASVVQQKSKYTWNDDAWMSYRKDKNALDKPFSVYEVHLESWKKKEGNQNLSFQELAHDLVSYVADMNFTHVEFMPIMEYPYPPSWGYQITGYFAPSSRFGSPDDLKYLIDQFHQNDIGVLLDWVPSHFPEDDHGLGLFDGSHLYEYPDPKKGYHQDWKSLIFNYGRNEVKAFLISNAVYWLQEYHIDGLRVDAVASILYLDYSREEGEWEPNVFGGRENLEAIDFLKALNKELYSRFEGIQTIAEESTSYPGVTKPIDIGGLGFGMKWMMGWMNDSLEYFSKNPVYRKYHQNDITFSLVYAFSENFMLPLSHDEVVHGKRSLIYRMPGDEWNRFANMRTMKGLMYTHPGTKLLFMGAEFGQTEEWNAECSLDWHLLAYEPHQKYQAFIKDLNRLYTTEPALYEKAFGPDGFEWISWDDSENSVISYIRKGHDRKNDLIVVCNFTAVPRNGYTIGVPFKGKVKCILNSDLKRYYGSSDEDNNSLTIENKGFHNKQYSLNLKLPPLSVQVFKQI